jgi:glutathione synthase/RimK-type ligase-like ATP-grasp enzyme
MTAMSVALATYAGLPEGDECTVALVAALARLGIAGEAVVWDDPAADWGRHDLVVVRSTWDYTLRREEFLAWAGAVPRLFNGVDVLRWNTDKRYLRELTAAGVPVVETRWDLDEVPADWDEYVIKPAVSAGSADTARWRRAEREAARAHLHHLRSAGRTVMVQPYLSAVDNAGETALVFCDGEFSHAARKGPILTAGSGVQAAMDHDADPREQISPAEATAAELDVARQALAAVRTALGSDDLLYARVDVIPGADGSPVLLELELTEPSLFLRHAPGAADRFARAIAARRP